MTPEDEREYADATPYIAILDMFIQRVQEGGVVPLSKDGEVLAMVVSPEVAQAGLRALGREV
jgi:hypothetical protein